MKKFFARIAIGMAVLRAVIRAVEQFEIPGFGLQKKQAVLEVIGALYDVSTELSGVTLSRPQVLDLASKLIDIVVAFKNLTGQFQHS